MARRNSKPPSGPNNGYLISFGDTMTALLAFFIVLNSLASEQTGANLYSGTGSFMEVSESMGVPGLFTDGQSAYAHQFDHASPLYIVNEDGEDHFGASANGPDKDGDTTYVRDREQENYERFLNEMQRLHDSRKEEEIEGEVAFDRLEPLEHAEPIDEELKRQLLTIVPMLQRNEYEVEIRVWSTTPALTAWKRAAEHAVKIEAYTRSFFERSGRTPAHLTATASLWTSPDLQRPSLSLIVRRLRK